MAIEQYLNYDIHARLCPMIDGMPIKRIGWTVNESDVRSREELRKLYKDAYLSWKGVHESAEYQTYKPVMVFKRYPMMYKPPEPRHVFLDAFLGFPDKVYDAILNDSWTIDLRETKKENIMMDAFLRGFSDNQEELQKLWGKEREKMDTKTIMVDEELKDLLRIYTDAEEHLRRKVEYTMQSLKVYMKKYLEEDEEHKKVLGKLAVLKNKMKGEQPLEQEEDEEDEEDDE